MKPRLLNRAFALAALSWLASPTAFGQIIPIDSEEKLRFLPDALETTSIRESHKLSSLQGEKVYFKTQLLFGGTIGATLSEYHFNSMTITLRALFYASDSVSGHAESIPDLYNGTNQGFTRLSIVPDALSIFSLKNGFAGRAINDALITWSKGSPLLLIEGGDAWNLMTLIGNAEVIQAESVGDAKHEISLAKANRLICTRESFGKAGAPVTEQVACLLLMDPQVADLGTFAVGCSQQQSQQQRRQQQQQRQRQQQTQPQQKQLQMQMQRQQPQPCPAQSTLGK
jgi:hypothetical protein